MNSDLKKLLARHRSIRAFKPTPVDDALIVEALEQASNGGSSWGNLNCYSAVVTKDKDNLEQLYKLHKEQEMIRQAAGVITFCADLHHVREWLKARKARDSFDNFMSFLVGFGDSMVFAQNTALGLEARGLGICYMGTTLYSAKGISKLLGLPNNVFPITSLVFGVPDEQPPIRQRLPVSSLVHFETYPEITTEWIDETYRSREVLAEESRKNDPKVDEQYKKRGARSLADLYTDSSKYHRETFQDMSLELLELLKEKEFFMHS